MWSKVKARAAAVASVAALVSLPVFAQEPDAKKADAPTPAKKAAYDPARRVPPYFAQIGLTPEQREEIYKVRAKHLPKIEELRKQITKINDDILAESEAVLSDSQRQILHQRRDAAAASRKAKIEAAREKPAEKANPE